MEATKQDWASVSDEPAPTVPISKKSVDIEDDKTFAEVVSGQKSTYVAADITAAAAEAAESTVDVFEAANEDSSAAAEFARPRKNMPNCRWAANCMKYECPFKHPVDRRHKCAESNCKCPKLHLRVRANDAAASAAPKEGFKRTPQCHEPDCDRTKCQLFHKIVPICAFREYIGRAFCLQPNCTGMKGCSRRIHVMNSLFAVDATLCRIFMMLGVGTQDKIRSKFADVLIAYNNAIFSDPILKEYIPPNPHRLEAPVECNKGLDCKHGAYGCAFVHPTESIDPIGAAHYLIDLLGWTHRCVINHPLAQLTVRVFRDKVVELMDESVPVKTPFDIKMLVAEGIKHGAKMPANLL